MLACALGLVKRPCSPVGVAYLLGVEPAGEEEDERGDAHEEEARGKVGVQLRAELGGGAALGVRSVDVGQGSPEQVGVGHGEQASVEEDLREKKRNDQQQLK
jgi:hypothetical protein